MQMQPFLSGFTTMGFCVAGMFFLRFWRQTNDSLFGAFAVAFWLFAVNQALVVVLNADEGQFWIYLLRLAGFGVIIAAILRKNMERSPPPP